MDETFNLIEKQNGKDFADFIHKHDDEIFSIPDIVNILEFAGRDAMSVINYLTSLKKQPKNKTQKNPFFLLYKAGYKAEYIDTFKKQSNIKKYFHKGEKLCTFYDGDRHKNYHIINAVKKTAHRLKRSDFKAPSREDEYSISVISIQILKNGGNISIKNRYNYSVLEPGNTFKSNPDYIIPGLTESLKNYFKVDFSVKLSLLPDGYTLLGDKIFKFNYKVRDVYFAEDFYIKEDKVYKLDKDNEIMMDYFVFNLATWELHNPSVVLDGFTKAFKEETHNKKLKLINNPDGTKSKLLMSDENCLIKIEDGKITSINMPSLIHAKNYFLYYNKVLSSLDLPNLLIVDDGFLYSNTELTEPFAPKLVRVGNFCIKNNKNLSGFNAKNKNLDDNTISNTDQTLPEQDVLNKDIFWNGYFAAGETNFYRAAKRLKERLLNNIFKTRVVREK